MVQEAPGFSHIYDIRLKTITLEGYASNSANTSFFTFFVLNARARLSMRIKFFNKKFLTVLYVEQHKKEVSGGPKGF